MSGELRVRAASGEERAFSFSGWREISRDERMRLAMKKAGKIALLAFAFVFIPGLHFLLVPGSLAFAAWTFWKTLRVSRSAMRSEGACPKCAAPVVVEGQAESYMLHCDSCRALLRVTLPG